MPAALGAVAASALAFALYVRVEWAWFWLGWIGLVPWLAVLDRCRTVRGALAAAWLMCAAFVVAVFAWFASAISFYTSWPPAIALLVLVVAAPLLQPQFFAFALARHFAGGREGRKLAVWIAACTYVATEWAWPKLFGDTIGHGFLASPTLRQAADLGGAHAFTFVLLVSNQLAWESLRRARAGIGLRRVLTPLGVVASIVLVLSVYGVLRLREFAAAATAPVNVALVQANLADYDGMRERIGAFATVRRILDEHFELSRAALSEARVDLLVWPETVYPTTFAAPKSEEGAAFDREIAGFVSQTRTPLVFGAYDSDGVDEFNAAVVLQPRDSAPTVAQIYRKAWPFPLTEHVPAWMDTPRVRSWLPWLGNWKPGGAAHALDIALADGRRLRVAPLICLDAVDPRLAIAAVRDGAQMIVTLSNDSWFAVGNGPRLHLVVSAFRSLETRRAQLRATNTGISAVISPTGELLSVAPVGARTVLTAAVTPMTARSLMLVWGDWFGPAALIGGALLSAIALVRRRTL